jgi:hypothetical protein
MNRQNFRKEYYRAMSRIYTVANAVMDCYADYEKTPSMLDAMIDGERCACRDVFEYGLFLLARGLPKENVDFILSNIVETYMDKNQKFLASIQKEAVLYIPDKDKLHPFKIMLRLDSRVRIKNNAVSRACAEYWKEPDACAFEHIEGNVARMSIKIPQSYRKAVEQIFTRTEMVSEKTRREGLDPLRNEIDIEKAAAREIFDYGLLLVAAELTGNEVYLILTRCIESEKNPAKKRLKRMQQEAVLNIHAGCNWRIIAIMLLALSGLKEREMQKIKEQYESLY